MEAEIRLDREWVRDETQERADIRESVEPIRRFAGIGADKPTLQQRGARAETQERQPHGHQKQSQYL